MIGSEKGNILHFVHFIQVLITYFNLCEITWHFDWSPGLIRGIGPKKVFYYPGQQRRRINRNKKFLPMAHVRILFCSDLVRSAAYFLACVKASFQSGKLSVDWNGQENFSLSRVLWVGTNYFNTKNNFLVRSKPRIIFLSGN